jgi:hypothetical protein
LKVCTALPVTVEVHGASENPLFPVESPPSKLGFCSRFTPHAGATLALGEVKLLDVDEDRIVLDRLKLEEELMLDGDGDDDTLRIEDEELIGRDDEDDEDGEEEAGSEEVDDEVEDESEGLVLEIDRALDAEEDWIVLDGLGLEEESIFEGEDELDNAADEL